MSLGLLAIAGESRRLARLLPFSVIESVVSRLEQGDSLDRDSLRNKVARSVPSAHHRALVIGYLDACRLAADPIPASALAVSLLTAAVAEREHRAQQSVELVWTGPDVGVVPVRRTEQVVLQVIDSATARLLVVSYAVFNIPRICDSLLRAADRDVAISVIVESSDRIAGQNAYSTLAALGPAVAGRSSVYLWPIEARFKGGGGKPGLLHVKCAVADGRWLFLSSANLTEQAFSINMELGVLITGGGIPAQVEAQFGKMIESKTLLKA
jgi:phosphatidylserine/phosphatidylglycerophosphate/cardiolipin synthase-like enzyme